MFQSSMGTLQNNMFIPKGLDETDPPPHQEIVEHDVEWKDIRERLFVYDADDGRSFVDWTLVYCLTQEQLEQKKLANKNLGEILGFKPGNWVRITFEASTAEGASASGS
jgi:hypothetical protein